MLACYLLLALVVGTTNGAKHASTSKLAIAYIGRDGNCSCAPGSGGKGQYGGGLDELLNRFLGGASKAEQITYAKLKLEFAQRYSAYMCTPK